MRDVSIELAGLHVAVVIPALDAAGTISSVLEALPAWVRTVVVVSDGSRDETEQLVRQVARDDPRVVLEVHGRNLGVGAATRTGYRRALDAGADVVVKMDSDGQMDPTYLPQLVLPIAYGQADYTKGNRFLRPEALRRMPVMRLVGNAVLSFLSKASSGYWNILDPTNGYTAISRQALVTLDLSAIDDGWFFESSMLTELALVRAVVADVPIPSRYADETSHLSLLRNVGRFATSHVRYGLRRLLYRHLLMDFTPTSLLLVLSLPLILFGVFFGARSWVRSIFYGTPATAGTVMLAAFTTGGGLFALFQAMIYDMLSGPQRPLTLPRKHPDAAEETAHGRIDGV
jgi:glycosyltransferase involved in cell wall biosynthesis